jgi:hypothetical protein
MSEETKEKLNEKLEEKICQIIEEDISPNNIEMLDMLVDIHKDVANEEYWKGKENSMRYSNYGRGYNEGSYGRRDREYGARSRDSRGRYKGHEYIDEMYGEYGNYEEGRQEYNRGNYGAKNDTLKSLEYMLESMVDFVEMLKSEAGSQEEMELIRRYTQQIAQM